MSNRSIFKKVLSTSTDQVAEVLKALKSFFGCVYLENHHSPVIACLPTHYWQSNQQKIQAYTRIKQQQYQCTDSDVDIQHSLDFLTETPSNSETGFHGGYIGFVDYNFAANQSVKTASLDQPQFYIGRYSSYIKREQQHWIFYSHEAEAEQIYQLIQSRLTAQSTTVDFRLKTPCTALWSKSQYQSAFEQVQQYIRAGDCYQINLTSKGLSAVSSQASLNATPILLMSLGSRFPPGNDTSPAWLFKYKERRVNKILGSSSWVIAINTAACAG